MCALRGHRNQQAKALGKSNHSNSQGLQDAGPPSQQLLVESKVPWAPFSTDSASYKFQVLILTLLPIICLPKMYAMEA